MSLCFFTRGVRSIDLLGVLFSRVMNWQHEPRPRSRHRRLPQHFPTSELVQEQQQWHRIEGQPPRAFTDKNAGV